MSAIALFSVAGGKFHKPAVPSFDRRDAWQLTATACGRKLIPQNYFVTVEDANQHTGGRIAHYLCAHCAKPEAD